LTMRLLCGKAKEPPEGIWWPVERIGEAGLPTLFAKLAARGAGWSRVPSPSHPATQDGPLPLPSGEGKKAADEAPLPSREHRADRAPHDLKTAGGSLHPMLEGPAAKRWEGEGKRMKA
jgi:hypothetical protein